MIGALPRAEDLAGIVIPSNNEAVRLLSLYADTLLDAEVSDATVLAQAGRCLLDLAALAFGTTRDRADVARLNGLRAARLAEVLRHIRLDFADPTLCPADIARRVGISTRTVHSLLHETGVSFSERVLELRLRKAFSLLCGSGISVHTISEAAYAAGFSDLSYFNRQFRGFFGLTPTAARRRH